MIVLTIDGHTMELTRKTVTVNDVGNTLYSITATRSGTIPVIDRAVPEILSEISETLKAIASEGIPR